MAATAKEMRDIVVAAEHNNAIIGDIVRSLNRFCRVMHIDPQDMDMIDADIDDDWIVFKLEGAHTAEWQSIEDVDEAAKGYSNIVALIMRGAEIHAQDANIDLDKVVIRRFHWLDWQRLAVQFSPYASS